MAIKMYDILSGNCDLKDNEPQSQYIPSYSLFKGIPIEYSDTITKGTEAIDFNISSNFTKELIDAIDSGMKYRDSILQELIDLNPKINRVDLVEKAKDKMIKYGKNELFPAMKKVILKHTNINISKIIDISAMTQYSITPTMLFAIDPSFNDTLSTINEIMDTITGYDVPVKKPTRYAEVYEEIASIWSTQDTKLNKPRKEVIQKVFKNLNISTTMYFDTLTAFFSHFYIPQQDAFLPFTAKEIAAIVIHEIGHIHTIIERMADDFYRKKYTEVAISDLINSRKTLDTKFDLIEEIIAYDEKNANKYAKKNTKIDTSTENKVSQLSIKIMKALSAKRESLLIQVGENTKGGVANALIDFLLWLVNLCIYSYMYSNAIFIKLTNELSVFYNIFRLSANRETRKHSDTVYTARNEFALETWADEFVVRLGLGGDLNSAFNKMDILSRIYYNRLFYTKNYLSGFKDTWLYYIMSKFIYAMNTIVNYSDKYVYLTHENTPDRVKTIERLMIDYFKANRDKYNPEMMDKMIKDFEKAVKAVKEINDPGFFYKVINILGVISHYLSTPIVVLSTLFKICSKSEYYNDLQNAINTIENNKMFYHKAKLDQLANKFE